MLTNREIITFKLENTYRTDSTPAVSADEVLVENPSWTHEGLRMAQRNPVRVSLGKLAQIYAGTLKAVSFDVELKGSGTAGTVPELGTLLRACGMGETISAGTSVTYASVSTGHEPFTMWYYQDGTLHKLNGCRGNVAFNLAAGEIGKLSFTITGHPGTVTDATLPTAAYNATVPAPFINAGFAVDSYADVINALTFDLGNTIATPPDVNQSNGYGEIQIVSRDINGSFDPEHELVAVEDFIGNFTSGKSMALTTGAIGSTAGNICTITMPGISFRDVSPADRDGIRSLEIPFGAAETTTDNELSIAFT